MDADFIFSSEIQSLGYSNVDEINPSHLVDLALRFAIGPL
jgi:hypothetical protein